MMKLASNNFTLPLFPLSAHILPGGAMSLRIFEPRYIRMVKDACANQTGLVICMLNGSGEKQANEHIYKLGTFVTIEDFDLLDDGLLGIKVQGHKCVRIESITTEFDDLRIGQCQWVDNWTCNIEQDSISPMDKRLREIFDNHPELKLLYSDPQFDNPLWVIYRWLEILPIKARQKQLLLDQKDCSIALEFLSQLVE